MIILSGELTIQPDKRDEFIASAKNMVELTLNGKGCSEFRFTTSWDDENTFQLFEIWESEELLQKHLKADYFAAYVENVRSMLQKPATVNRFEVTNKRPLYGS